MHVVPPENGSVRNGIHRAILEVLKPKEPTTVRDLIDKLRTNHDEGALAHAIFDLLETREVKRNDRGQLLRAESAVAQ